MIHPVEEKNRTQQIMTFLTPDRRQRINFFTINRNSLEIGCKKFRWSWAKNRDLLSETIGLAYLFLPWMKTVRKFLGERLLKHTLKFS